MCFMFCRIFAPTVNSVVRTSVVYHSVSDLAKDAHLPINFYQMGLCSSIVAFRDDNENLRSRREPQSRKAGGKVPS